jgi:hypothetical protein
MAMEQDGFWDGFSSIPTKKRGFWERKKVANGHFPCKFQIHNHFEEKMKMNMAKP